MTNWPLRLAVLAFVCLGLAVSAQEQHPQGKRDHMEHRFDDPERYAKSFDDPARDSWQMPARVIDALKLPPGASVADIGAGTGYFSVRLARAVPRGTVYAVDVEPAMLEHIRKRAIADRLSNIVTVQASGTNANVPKPVDLVLIVDTYHHLPNRATYFRELAKSVAPGGRVAIIDFRKDSPSGPPPEFRFEADQIVAEMKQAGYRLETKHDFLPRQHFLVFRTGTAGAAAVGQITPRHEHGYVRVGDKFYLLGGRGIKPVDIFDPATGTWTRGAPSPVEIHHFQAVVFDGKIYLVGAMTGAYPKEPPLPSVYVYDPASDAWSTGPEVPPDRRRGGAGAVVYGNEIYVVAGITNGHYDGHVTWVDALNPRTGQWRRLPDAPHARDHFHAAIIGDKIYAAGGRRSSAATNQTFQLTEPAVDVFDLKTSQWSTLPASGNIHTQRAGAAAAVVDGKLIVLGGESGQPLAHDAVESLDPATGRWTVLKPLSMGRHATQAILHQGRIYLASGSRTRGATEVDTQEIYTPGAAK